MTSVGALFKRGKIRIELTGTDRRSPVDAEIHGPLAIHQASITGKFTVCHIATGRRIALFKDVDRARDFIDLIAPLDWDFQAADEVPKSTATAMIRILNGMERPQ